MARDEFCGVETSAHEWSRFPARPHWDVGRRPDALDMLMRDMWQWPGEGVNCVAIEEQPSLAEQFRVQSEKWEQETVHLSSPTQKFMHPSYQAILGMARDDQNKVIRLLLRDLQQNRREWFWALSYLTRENPIDRKDAGNMDKMIAAWVRWGKQRGLL